MNIPVARLAVPIALGAALLLVGCTTPGTAPTTVPPAEPTGDTGTPAAVAEAIALVDQYSVVPGPKQVAPLVASPPTDISIVYIGCPLPICSTVFEYISAATSTLGWQSREIVADFTPEAVQAAFDSALQLNPDGIEFISTMPREVISEQLAKAQEAGIWVVSAGDATVTEAEVGPGTQLTGDTGSVADRHFLASLQAAMVIKEAAASGDSLDDVGYIYDPAPSAYAVAYEVFAEQIEAAGGSVTPIEVNQAGAGTTIPGEIVSFLQTHPNIKYLGIAHDSFLTGIPDAVLAANLPLPKVVGLDPAEENFEMIRDGRQFGSVLSDLRMLHWDVVDLFARVSVDTPEDQMNRLIQSSVIIVTKDNVEDAYDIRGGFPGVPDSYIAAWGKN